MDGGNRVNILECVDMIILVDCLGWNLLADDLVEDGWLVLSHQRYQL